MNLVQIVTLSEAFLMEACPNTFEITALKLTEGSVNTVSLVNEQLLRNKIYF